MQALFVEMEKLTGVDFVDLFRSMEIADEEIRAAQSQNQAAAMRLNGMFQCMQPSPILKDKGEKLLRAHYAELLERAVKSEKPILETATLAEVLAALSEASLTAPPTRTAYALSNFLFEKIFGLEASKSIFGASWETTYNNADWRGKGYQITEMRELETKIRKKLENNCRRFKGW